MRILVCGGRDYNDYANVERVLNEYWINPRRIDVIIEGGATGADKMAKIFAERNNIFVEEYKAKWELYGKGAGYIRNKEMLDTGKPDLVIAFPGGRGTKNMVEQARKEGVLVREICIEEWDLRN